jgi:hypothetical protein
MDLPSETFADILDGNVDIQILGVGPGGDRIAVDYSRLTIEYKHEYEQVPEPLNILSGMLTFGFSLLCRRRSK